MASITRSSWCRLAKLRGVSRTVSKLYISTDVTKKDRVIDRVKKFVFGEGPPPEEDETPERLAIDYLSGIMFLLNLGRFWVIFSWCRVLIFTPDFTQT